MYCTKCGAQMPEDAKFCTACGEKFTTEEPKQTSGQPQQTYQQPAYEQPQQTYQQPVYGQQSVVYRTQQITSPEDLPKEYRPLSAWAYFGLTLLFSIPVVGFVFLIVFSCNGSNINRRSYARSYWCALLVSAIALVVAIAVLAATGGLSAVIDGIRHSF